LTTIFPGLLRFFPIVLLLLRLLIAAIFIASGWNDLKAPEERAKSIEKSKAFTIFLGIAEVLGGVGVAVGVLPQLAALGLILIMLGAIYEKIFVWHTGFWGEKGSGWHYDLMLVSMNLIVVFTDGGPYVLTKLWTA
jgi:putative oxidoreductase